jgi:signal peptidase I
MEKNANAVRRRWWIAGLFSYLVPGLGQVYNGQATRGLLFNFIFTTWGGILFGFVFRLLNRPPDGTGILFLFVLFAVSLLIHLAVIIDSIASAAKRDSKFSLKPYNKPAVYLAVLVVSFAVDFSISSALREHVIKPFKIPTGSMEPTLVPGDFLLSNQLFFTDHNPGRGDVVIYKSPQDGKTDFIKRIVGVPGDTIDIEGGRVRIDGRSVEEPYVKPVDPVPSGDISGGAGHSGPLVIPMDQYYVLGDNRDHSLDSRQVGPIPRHSIKGKPMVIYFSSSGLFKWRPGRIGRIIR